MLRTSSFEAVRESLEQQLSHSAVRRGISAHRLGLIQHGVSDHLPIVAEVKNANKEKKFSLLSWNTLADAHLYNNFLNVTGQETLAQSISKENIYYDKLFYFFAELAQYLYNNQRNKEISINRDVLTRFISIKNQPSNLTRSVGEKRIETARADIIRIITEKLQHDTLGHEYRLAIQHCLELIYHIEHSEGALKWANRFKLLLQNKPLIKEITQSDFVCLQECTDPTDIEKLFQSESKPHSIVTHQIGSTRDHCVLIFDHEKFQLLGEPIKYALDGKKPCILAKFKDIRTHEIFIVASIHHPGGDKNLVDKLLEQINTLRTAEHPSIPFYLAGDFNHAEDFFHQETVEKRNYKLVSPSEGTLAGSDYGNTNKAIDGVIVDQRTESVSVHRLAGLPLSRPASNQPITVRFFQPQKLQVHISAQDPLSGNKLEERTRERRLGAVGT